MRINVHKSVPEDLRDITRVAVRFYLDCFVGDEIQDRLESLSIRFLADKEKDTVACIETMGIADDDFKTVPTRFLLKINDRFLDIKIGDYLCTLFHEMTHMKQMASKRLMYSTRGGWLWLGKHWDAESEYWLQPWEMEAQGTEVSALQLFMKTHPQWCATSRRRIKYNGRASSGWKPYTNQPLTNP